MLLYSLITTSTSIIIIIPVITNSTSDIDNPTVSPLVEDGHSVLMVVIVIIGAYPI